SEIASFTAAKGTIVNLSEYTTEREGFNFVSWYSDEAMTKAVVLVTVNADVTLYAKWEEIDNFANFVKKNTYTLNYFVDIDEDGKWYGAGTDPLTGNPREGVIKACFEYGLMDGVTEDPMFDPEGNLTIAQTVTLAARIHNIYNGGDGEFEQGPVWYEVYVDYAIENNIIGKYEFSDDYTRAATRAEMAYIFVNALGADGYKAIRNVESIPDVAKDAKYAEEIYLLYNAGVLSGNDELGTFTPDASIQRSAAAAIIARAAKIVERQSFAIPDIAE
ncbi:MAG: InlB B-repeat-containing protein, partial [Oscillospiraceae bacterium]|nr:InlB B-repeat-containing protein [Oscillospiraceae bacterium]